MATQTPTKSTAALGSTQRTNDLLREASQQTGTKSPTFSSGPIATQTSAIRSSGAGAVNSKGQIVGAGGQILGMANSADLPGAGSPRVSPTQPIPQTPQPTQLDPNAEAPQSMIDQASQLQNQVNQLASQKGLTLKQNATGQYTATPDLSAQYKQAKSIMDQSGVSPVTAGQGQAAVQAATKAIAPQTESPSILGPIQETDSMFDSLFTQYDDFFSPQTQRTSLIDEYNNLSKSLGLDAINAELIDTKRIIDGTEDDIRSEITAAGGTATESQVMAMANSRNKQLIKNYNYLLDTKNATTTQLSTLMQLSVQDRQFAEAEFDRKLNFGFQVAQFQQTAKNNARQTYLTLGKDMGWDVLLSSVTPYEQGIIGKTIGLDRNGLNNLALRSQQDRILALQEAQLRQDVLRSNLETDKAQRANLYSQINERNTKPAVNTLNGKDQTSEQAKANGYADRLTEADQVISTIGSQFTKVGSLGGLMPSMFQSPERQQYEQAKKNFITAVLRRESGASIAPTEFSTADEQYFPQPGDKTETVKQKEANRNTVINNFYREANVARPLKPGQVIEVK